MIPRGQGHPHFILCFGEVPPKQQLGEIRFDLPNAPDFLDLPMKTKCCVELDQEKHKQRSRGVSHNYRPKGANASGNATQEESNPLCGRIDLLTDVNLLLIKKCKIPGCLLEGNTLRWISV
jgi:hypothetical protein